MKSLKELYRPGKGQSDHTTEETYPHETFEEIKDYCRENKLSLTKYVEKFEGREIWVFFSKIWNSMRLTVANGLDAEGFIGNTETRRKAKQLYEQNHVGESPEELESRLICACSFAVSEESASGEQVINVPSRSSCGVLPAVLLYMQEKKDFSDSEIIRALAAAGIIGNIIKAALDDKENQKTTTAAACAMSAAALAELHDMELEQIECAAELALRYTSIDSQANEQDSESTDEKNAMAALRAVNCITAAAFLTYTKNVSFDSEVKAIGDAEKRGIKL